MPSVLSSRSIPLFCALLASFVACGGKVFIDEPTGSSGTSPSSSSSGAGGGSGECGPAGGLPALPCTPQDPQCDVASSACLAIAVQAGFPKFGLRMSQLTLTHPAAFTKGIVKSVMQGSVTPFQPSCNLQGQGTFSWLLDFDTEAGTITTGGAKPPQDPSFGYTFFNDTIASGGNFFSVSPVKLSATVGGCDVTSSEGSVFLPIFLDAGGTQSLILPLDRLRFHDGQVSADHNCIGRYNAAGLQPGNSCLPDDKSPSFVDGAEVDALISLEQADSFVIDTLSQTLCVLLSGDPQAFGDGGSPNKCRRQNGQIVFQGDWCSATNQAATAICADAVLFSGSFAASGVVIK